MLARPANSLGNDPRQVEKTYPSPESDKVFTQELVMGVFHHYPLLLLGPLFVALAAYIVAATLPSKYTSVAYLRMDRATARSVEALMTSPELGGKVLSKYPDIANSPEGHVRYLTQNLALRDIEPLGDRGSVRLFRLEFTHHIPREAQAISAQLIDAWLETTRPGPFERANIEGELKRNKIAADSNSALIAQLQKEATSLVMPNSLPGEIATPISGLINARDKNLGAITELEKRLAGISRDVIVAQPHLPVDPSRPQKRALAILWGVGAIPVFLALILLGRFFAPGRSIRDWFRRRAV